MPSLLPLTKIADFHVDADASLRLLFSELNPNYVVRFANYFQYEINEELLDRLNEADWRSSLVTLAHVEAALRVDYRERCKLKMADDISTSFRKTFRSRKDKARLDEDILNVWYQATLPADRAVISQLRGMFKFRHWLAHGRYWNFGQRYTFDDVYLVADAVLTGLPLCA